MTVRRWSDRVLSLAGQWRSPRAACAMFGHVWYVGRSWLGREERHIVVCWCDRCGMPYGDDAG